MPADLPADLPAPEDYAGVRAPFPLRRHQRAALDALAVDRRQHRKRDRDRAWVVLPPGAGKTMVGLETIRREGARTEGVRALILSPNTAIQEQWIRGWREFAVTGNSTALNPIPISADRELAAPVTSLTYQSLATFDAETADESDAAADAAEESTTTNTSTDSLINRLHPNGLALVEALRAAGPITLILDECHHLLQVWGRLLAELLESLPQASVLGLTATPPDALTGEEAKLVDDLFGEVVYASSIPAVVREGHLAPFGDLIWLTTPTAAEADWLAARAERFTELITQLTDPGFGSTPLLAWLDVRFAGQVPFERIAAQQPDLADAALRLRQTGLLRLPGDVVEREQHRHPPDADDWALLIDDWYRSCLRDSADERDEQVRAALRRALPAVGYQLTRRGVRKGRTSVDRVLARSAAKSAGMVEIIDAEHSNLGGRLSMLVICDHESATATATATVSADLRGVLAESAGSARLALAQLIADQRTVGLCPVMVTGRTVAAAPEVLRRLRDTVEGVELVVGEPDSDGIAELTGAWSSRRWVACVTRFFTAGEARVLIGTRALLGEGWDAPTATGLVDLSMAATPATVVQTRGRTLRLDPQDPAKVAINWTVCCVTDTHPNGDNDWQRAVRKHRGYFGVDAGGDVVDGVAHIHPGFSPYASPPVATFDATNAAMLLRASQRADIRASWRVGQPYADQIRQVVWLRTADRTRLPEPAPPLARAVLPAAVLCGTGVRTVGRARIWPMLPAATLTAALAAAIATLGSAAAAVVSWSVALLLVSVALAVASVALGMAAARRRRLLELASREPDLVRVAYALADGLHRAGLSDVGAAAVGWHVEPDGQLRCVLQSNRENSTVFADAIVELTAPIGEPRYLVPRYVADPVRRTRALLPLARFRPDGVIWHPVPRVLGVNAERAQAFAAAWQEWVGGGPAVFSQRPEGAGILATHRGLSPFDATCVLRLHWT